nr:MAG TPA: hypothetical protein [Caudoviricetes sp.]
MADFIYIDGVEYRPDEDLVKLIKEHFQEKRHISCFDKVAFGKDYFFIGDEGIVHKERHAQTFTDTSRYKIGNYCTNYSYIVSRAREENLLRRVWRFSLENGGDKIDWGDSHQEKYYLWVDVNEVKINNCTIAHHLGQVYFISKEVAEKARDIFEKEIIDVYETTDN